MSDFTPRDGDALLVIDVQNDFCDGGALAVPDGDAIVPIVNALAQDFATAGHPVVFTQDWHPPDHRSFASQHSGKSPFETVMLDYGEQTLWPDHCIQSSAGAEFHAALVSQRAEAIVRKGFRAAIDSYSAFRENDRETGTGLEGYLRERGVRRVVCTGLAFDFCVRWSAEDARQAGFEAVVLRAATRGIDLDGSVSSAEAALDEAGVAIF